ncbi:MAG: serine/threonine protein kinase [Betaproteobacteria bacterium]|nr:serine/threonine protein kinase [Betaproteobacteria bacterium]
MALSRDQWQRVEPLFHAALDLSQAERAHYLDRLDTTDPSLSPLLRQLIATHERAEAAREMETVPKLAPPPPASSDFSAGMVIGAFQLIAPLGKGGMGEVWRAVQIDGRVEREVALKLPMLLQRGPVWRERFARERDILARLNHPHIARLYDAGVSETEGSRGQPYLAMEVVQGVSITEYLQANKLPVAQRLALFRQMLSAVAHAHRHLTVHRDLKPANILIDAEGQVKLLDFGIAKLVEDDTGTVDATELTRIGGRAMTLRYCAPEQVAGEAISTATDIYAMGVILFEMLTGASPYRAVREGRGLTELAITTEDIARPSSVANTPELAGDLDAIVLKALRRDPGERYASAEAFAADLDAYATHRPVAARDGTRRYLFSRFVARNKWPLGVAAGAVLALGVGVAMVEQQRRTAVAEKARAERHFESVRKLANTFIFDVNEQLSDMPGTLKARETLVKTALQYLDNLAAEAGSDPALKAELASAYLKIGNVQGQPGSANLGDAGQSKVHYEKAKRLFAELGDYKANDISLQRDHLRLRYALARMYAQRGDARWQEDIEAAVRLAERVATLDGAGPRDRARVAGALAEQAHLISILVGQTPEAEAKIDKAIALLEALNTEMPGQTGVIDNLASTYQRAANIFSGNRRTPGSLTRAIGYREKATTLFIAQEKAHPEDQRYRSILAENRREMAANLMQAGRHAEAEAAYRIAIANAREYAKADPADAARRADVLDCLATGASIAQARNEPREAFSRAREGLAIFRALPAETRALREVRSEHADAQMFAGLAQIDLSARLPASQRVPMLKQACDWLEQSVAFLQEVRVGKQGAIDEASASLRTDGLARCRTALAQAEGGR